MDPKILFRMRLREDGQFTPDHVESNDAGLVWDDPTKTYEEKREMLFGIIDADPRFAGMYRLEWLPEELRADRVAAVTERTRLLLREGFMYGTTGQRFASDSSSQAYYNLLRIESAPALGFVVSYPVVIPTLDDQSDVELTAFTLPLFLAAAASHVRAIRNGDAALKRELREAETLEAIAAVVDTR